MSNSRIPVQKAFPWEQYKSLPALQDAMAILPANYEFEIPKTIWKVVSSNAKVVALQFPEGLTMYACIIADIIKKFTGTEVIILADVTYGACCVDDFTADKVGADLLVHYGHSCLVPVQQTSLKTLYVFVEIYFDTTHLVDVLKANFPKETRLCIMGTVQFLRAVHEVFNSLNGHFEKIVVPQVKPLSKGETLGCTSAKVNPEDNINTLVFIADGRFHMEAAMIANSSLAHYRYCPYSKVMTLERYDLPSMLGSRKHAIETAQSSARTFGIILGTLGHQGNVKILERLKQLLTEKNKRFVVFLMSEINVATIAKIPSIDCWVQISCPRLSIDWGAEFTKPLLNPYEAMVMLERVQWKTDEYPMDYYSNNKTPWSNYY